MTETLSAAEQSVVEAAASFAAEHVAPAAAQWEWQRQYPLDVLRLAAKTGLTGLIVPAEYGGLALSSTAMARVMEELAAADMGFAFALVVHNNLQGNIARNGTAMHRERYLPALQSMDQIGAFLLTEPLAGSDAAALKTTATRDGEDWIINGEKAWVTNASHADVLSVYAQTDPAAGWRGIGCFLVDRQTPGVTAEPTYQMLGGHAMGAGAMRFDQVRVGADQLLVEPERGFKAAMAGIDLARANVAAMCSGMLRTCLAEAMKYGQQRNAFGQSLAQFQGRQWMLADVATDCHAARLMAYHACQLLDDGQDAALAAAHAKKFATRVALHGISECMQSIGANGLLHEYSFSRHLAGAKIAQYLDGATEIQNVVISRAMAKSL